jgi:asparagine synthase (glutamine-hydrolysing)
VLSGEGADELFGGYPTYLGHKIVPYYRALPSSSKRAIERGLARLPVSSRKVTLEFLLRQFVANVEREWVERHLAWFGVGLAAASSAELPFEWLAPLLAEHRGRPPLCGAMLLDYCTSLREKLLVKSDRATMLNSIEARAPFLDWQLTAFAFSLPERDKLRGLTTKWILKQAAMPLLPRALALRRKRGLSVPIAMLINGALREDVDRCLGSHAVRAHNLLHEATVQRLLAEHRAGHANHARLLWPAITLQYWAERWRPTATNLIVAPPATIADPRCRDAARQFVQH